MTTPTGLIERGPASYGTTGPGGAPIPTAAALAPTAAHALKRSLALAPALAPSPAAGAALALTPALSSAAADGERAPQGLPAPDNEFRTGGAGGNFRADGGAEDREPPTATPSHHKKAAI